MQSWGLLILVIMLFVANLPAVMQQWRTDRAGSIKTLWLMGAYALYIALGIALFLMLAPRQPGETKALLLPHFAIVGLPDNAVAESRERVRGALNAIGLALPPKRITVNLAPADLPKEGSHYDLPVALGLMAATGAIAAMRSRASGCSANCRSTARLRQSPGPFPRQSAPTLSARA